jgi:hypothetical protein
MTPLQIGPFWRKWLRALPDGLARPRAGAMPMLDVATLEDRILFSVTPLVDGAGAEMAAIDQAMALVAAELNSAEAPPDADAAPLDGVDAETDAGANETSEGASSGA